MQKRYVWIHTQVVPELEQEDMERLQREDPSLETVWKAADQETSSNRASFVKKNGILYRVCAHRKEEASAREQLVLPNKYRKLVLELAHRIPLAGHLGKHKTTDRILQRFYWPTARSDVADYCKRCETCQKTSRVKPPRAPLIPFPVMGVIAFHSRELPWTSWALSQEQVQVTSISLSS